MLATPEAPYIKMEKPYNYQKTTSPMIRNNSKE